MTTNPEFADWYRSAAVSPPEGLLNKRWAGVDAVSKRSKASTVLELAHFFAVPGGSVPSGLREAFQAHDDTFPGKDNLQEMRVLAGAVLRNLIEGDAALATTAALALVSGSFDTRLATLPERDHIDAAERYLVRRARAIRETHGSPVANQNFTSAKVAERLAESVFAGNLAALREPLATSLNEIAADVAQAQSVLKELAQGIRVQAEELNMLWWLQAAFSRDLQTPFASIGDRAAVLVFPMELADLTVYVPGPDVVPAILTRAFESAGATDISAGITLADAINATPRTWRETVHARHRGESATLLCPVLLAIEKSLATDGPEDWFPVYRKACDIPLTSRIPLAFLGLQLYRERLLLAVLPRSR